jgi:hypothetical protein
MADVTRREALSSSIRYWEPRRILYNAALLVVVCTVYFLNLPTSRQDLSFGLLQGLFVLAVLANVAYCAAVGISDAMVEVTLGPIAGRYCLCRRIGQFLFARHFCACYVDHVGQLRASKLRANIC